jgi:hypothetical protein
MILKRLLALPVIVMLASPAAAFDESDPVARDIAQLLVMKAYVTHAFEVCAEKYGDDAVYSAASADWLAHNAEALGIVEAAVKKTGKFTDDDRKALEAAIFNQVETSIAGDADPAAHCKSVAAEVTARNRDIEDFPGGSDIIERLKKV